MGTPTYYQLVHLSGSEEDELIRQLEAQKRRGKIITVIFLVCFASTPFALMAHRSYKRHQERQAELLTPAEQAEVRRLLDARVGERAKCEAEWKDAAKAETLRALGGSCGAHLLSPTAGAGSSYTQSGSIDGNYFGSWGLSYVGSPEAIAQRSGSCGDGEWREVRAREELAMGTADKGTLRWARYAGSGRGSGYDVYVVASERKAPITLSGSFIAGAVSGHAYLYSRGAGRFLCAFDFDARNSENVSTSFRYMKGNFLDHDMKQRQAEQAALGRDLEVQVRRAIAARVAQ